MADVTTASPAVGSNFNDNRFLITDGAQVDMVRLVVGGNTRGYLGVSGAGSRLFNDHNTQLGQYSGQAEALIAGGGEWEVRLGLTIGLGTADAHVGQAKLRVDEGTVKARNFIFSNLSILDATLHTGGTDSLLTTTGGSTHGVVIGPGGLTESPETSFVLKLAPGFDSDLYEVFTIIEVGSSSGIIDGKFRIGGQVLDEGDTITVDGFQHPFQASYLGGADGNDFTLTVIPEPGALSLLLVGALGILRFFRRR